MKCEGISPDEFQSTRAELLSWEQRKADEASEWSVLVREWIKRDQGQSIVEQIMGEVCDV